MDGGGDLDRNNEDGWGGGEVLVSSQQAVLLDVQVAQQQSLTRLSVKFTFWAS